MKSQQDKNQLKKWYYLLSLGRRLDERAPNYLKQALGWSYHAPYAGHDAIQLALGQVFKAGKDHLFPYYRDMLTVVSAGISAEEIILNGLSKESDIASGGRHMSNHFAKLSLNIHNVSSCTGNHTLHAVGLARALKYYGDKAVVFSSQGESSLSEGYCYEAINGASKEKLPVVFVIQDNGYGISVPKKDQTANEFASDNFSGLKYIKIIHCDGKDVFDSMRAMQEAREYALNLNGPVLVHADCVRIGAHSNSDKHELYRDEEELRLAKEQDPFVKFRKYLLQNKLFTDKDLETIDNEAQNVVIEAHKNAVKASAPKPDSIFNFVNGKPYQAPHYPEGLPNGKSKSESLFLIEAINQTLKEEFTKNPDTFLWGQDVANKEKGGIFNVTKGMQKMFGEKRIFNAPIAEDFIVGTANGFSRYNSKIRLCVEGAEFADYFWPAMEQLVDTSHDYWRSNGQFCPNITIRLASGGYIGGGIYHSQNLEGTFATLPGLRVVVPSFADDAAGLLRTCLRSEGLNLYLEPKALYNSKDAKALVEDGFEVPFGKARVRREGKDATIITYGNTTHFCIRASEILEEQDGVKVEVIDLRSLVPLDEKAIYQSVQKTNRVLVVHEDKVHAGFGGEIAALIAQNCFQYLDAPVLRLGSTFTPVGFNRILEQAVLPNTDKVVQELRKLLSF